AHELRTVKPIPNRSRMIDLLALRAVGCQTVGQRRELAREQLRTFPVGRGERTGPNTALQVHHPDRGAGADGRTENRLDFVAAHAGQILETGLALRRWRFHRQSLRDRLSHDSARDGRADRLHVLVGAPVPLPEPWLPSVVVVELQVSGARARNLDDQPKGLFEQGLELLLSAEVQKTPVEITLTREAAVGPHVAHLAAPRAK